MEDFYIIFYQPYLCLGKSCYSEELDGVASIYVKNFSREFLDGGIFQDGFLQD